MLMDELEDFKDPLSSADAIIVAIAHNSFALSGDQPCGTTVQRGNEQSGGLVESSLPSAPSPPQPSTAQQYDELFDTIASWRKGKPTLLRTIDKYNDWNGWEEAHL